MQQLRPILRGAAVALLLAGVHARAAEHVVLRNGFELDCARQQPDGDQVRLYLLPGPGDPPSAVNYLEVPASSIASAAPIPDPPLPAAMPHSPSAASVATAIPTPTAMATPSDSATLSATEMQQLLTRAGGQHDIDADLLAAVVHAESGGHVRAVSRTGARGLMQLMPGTAANLGVTNTFAPEQNITGGTAYLDQLLTRYHDNLALALAAYNAGPAAVDRYHGIPPFAETRAYVARVIREFNRRKLAARSPAHALAAAAPLLAATH